MPHRAPRDGAFTLIELLVVMAIMVIMLGLSIAAFKDIGSGAGMRGAVLQFKTNMSLARQNAITRRIPAQIVFNNGDANTRGTFWLASRNGSITNIVGATNYFAEGIVFDLPNNVTSNFEFKIDGTPRASFGSSNSVPVRVYDRNANPSNVTTFLLYKQTGRVKVFQGIQ